MLPRPFHIGTVDIPGYYAKKRDNHALITLYNKSGILKWPLVKCGPQMRTKPKQVIARDDPEPLATSDTEDKRV
jgi:hypothetical protein